MPTYSSDSASGIWTLNEARDAQYVSGWPTLYVPWSVTISDCTYDSVSFSVATQESYPTGLDFKPDGTVMYVVGLSGDAVVEYDLSTAWDISTASASGTEFSVNTQEASPSGLRFKTDGTKFYVSGSSGGIREYSMSTAWDISTASYVTNYNMVTANPNPFGFTFNNDGTKLYVSSNQNDTVTQHSLSTAWDISTASSDSVSIDNSDQATATVGIRFNEDGTRLYIQTYGGTPDDQIYQWSLTTAFDLSTATYDSVAFQDGQETVPRDFAFKSDGTKMYTVGRGTDTVYQFSTGL